MGTRRVIRSTLLCLIFLLAALAPRPAQAQNHRLLGDAPELGAWVEAAAVALHDDGLSGDAVAGDGVFTATVAFAAGTLPGPRTLRWRVLPDGATLAIGAKAQADGTAMRIDLPDALPRTIEFRFTPTAPPGFSPSFGLADSFTTGVATDPTLRRPVAFVAQGDFQAHLGGLPWNPALDATRLRDDGLGRDLLAGDDLATVTVLLPLPLDPSTELSWSIARQGQNAAEQSLELGLDGWGFSVDGVSPAPLTLVADPWRPMRFELDLLRGLLRQVGDDNAFVSPLLSEIATGATRLSFVEVVNPGPATLSLDGLFLSDDPAFGLLPSGVPPAATPGDVLVFFPPGALLLPGARTVVRWPGAESFYATYGRFPDHELLPSVAAVPEMLPGYPGAIGSNPSLDAAGEFLLLGRFAAGDALVEDIDLVTWGAPSPADSPPDRLDQMPTGAPPAYGPEDGLVRTNVAPGVALHARKALFEVGERRTPCTLPCSVDGSARALPSGIFDRALGGRHDETSEPLTSTWAVPRSATPGTQNTVDRHVTGVVEDGTGNPVAMANVEAVSGLTRVAAVSELSGAFRLGPLGAGRWTFQAHKAGAGASLLTTIRVAGDTVLSGPLVLDGTPSTYRVRGVVLDAGNGSGLVGATVTATPGGALGVAGSSGAYAIDLPAGAVTLVASAPGFAATGTSRVIGSDLDLNFTLAAGEPALSVSGNVADPGASPLAGVRLSLEANGVPPFVTASAQDGTFLFPAVLPDTTYLLRASLPGHETASSTLDLLTTSVTSLALELAPRAPTLAISGTVLDARDDTPLEGALVKVEGAASTFSDLAGTFLIPGLPDGDHRVAASLSTFATTQQIVSMNGADLAGITLRLIDARRFDLRVQVSDAGSGDPITGAQLTLLEDASGTTLLSTSDDRGEVTFVDRPPGVYTLGATAAAYLPASQTITLDADHLLSMMLDTDPDRLLLLQGVIALEGEDNTAFGGTLLLLTGPETAPSELRTETQDDGSYRFDDLRPGRYRLEAKHPGFHGGTLTLQLSFSDVQDLLLARETRPPSPPPGCSCRSVESSSGLCVLIALLGLFGIARRRHRLQ